MKLNHYIDHTNLKPSATQEDIRRLCVEAKQQQFASVCVSPAQIDTAKLELEGSDVHVCTVIGFPSGAHTTESKAFEAADAVRRGCDELDMVIAIGALREGRTQYVYEDIKAVVQAAQGRCVKVILETALLTDDEIVIATELACKAGANFVKTCTGFAGGGATVEHVRLMKQHVTDGVKVKASGGIKDYQTALALVQAGAERLGTSSGLQIVQGEADL